MLNDAITIGCCEKRFKLSSDLESLTMMIDKISDNPIFDYDSRVKDECGTRCKNKCIIIENLEEYNYMNKHGAIVCEHPLFIVPESNFIIYRKELKFVNLLTKEEFFKPVQFITNIDNDDEVLKYYNYMKEKLERKVNAENFTNLIKRSNLGITELYEYKFIDIYNLLEVMISNNDEVYKKPDNSLVYNINNTDIIIFSRVLNDFNIDDYEKMIGIKFYSNNSYLEIYTENNKYIYNIFDEISKMNEIYKYEENLNLHKNELEKLIKDIIKDKG